MILILTDLWVEYLSSLDDILPGLMLSVSFVYTSLRAPVNLMIDD